MTEPTLRAPRAVAPGAMTAVMRAQRAPAQAAPRQLRVALVREGRVVEERVIAPKTHVTVGASEACTFVVATSTCRLFTFANGRYRLHAPPGLTGRIAAEGKIVELATFEGDAIPLDDAARGRLGIGDATFLFQLVPARPQAGKPKLPLAMRASLGSDIDWTTAIVAAFSFLLHFGAAGALYSDWADPTVDDEAVVTQVIEALKQVPTVPLETVDASRTPVRDDHAAPKTAEPTKATGGGGTASKGGAPGARKGGGGMTNAQASALVDSMKALDLEMFGVLNGKGPSAAAVLMDGNVPNGMLEDAARSNAGVGRGGIAGLDMSGGRGGVVRPGHGGGAGLAGIGDTRASGPASAGSAQAVARPASVGIGAVDPTGGRVEGAPGVVARMSAGFRRCYNIGIAQEDPTMHGSVRITARIGPNGEVASATPSGGGGLSAGVIACVVQRVQSAQFSPPTGGGATLVIPIIFTAAQ